MYKRAFPFNGIGAKPEKLLINLPPVLMAKYEYYPEETFSKLGLNLDIEKTRRTTAESLSGSSPSSATKSYMNTTSNKALSRI